MLPASHRLRRPADFTATTRSGSRAGRSCLVLHVRRGPGVEPARVGFTVSKAVGGSVVRHRVTRRLRVAMRDLLVSLPTGSTVVVRALPRAATASVAELSAELRSAWASVEARG